MTAPGRKLEQDRARYRQAAVHLERDHDIRRTGTAGQLEAWHLQAHWLACTPTHDMWHTNQEDPRR